MMLGKRSRGLMQGIIHRPRSVWLRKAAFQIHLWIGVALALYATVIGITGSILVFGEELHALTKRRNSAPLRPAITMADAAAVVARTAPGRRITLAFPPTADSPGYTFVIPNHPNVYVDASSGKPVAPITKRTWLDVVSALHVDLLLGEKGRTVNGIGAAGCLLLAITGLLLWWPGVKLFSQSFFVDFGRGWRRIVWELHGVTGLYGLVMVITWSFTGLSFTWPQATRSALGWFSAISQPSTPRLSAGTQTEGPIEAILAHVDAAVPARVPGRLRWVLLPSGKGEPLMLMMSRELSDHALQYDRIYLDPATGVQIGAWRWEDGRSLSDWILRMCLPLHTGMYWGMFVKVLWASLGLLLPVLSLTGLVMYWNRFLRRKWYSIFKRRTVILNNR